MIYYIVFQLAYLSVMPLLIFSAVTKYDIKSHQSNSRRSNYANELMLVCHIESQPFQGGWHVRYLYHLRRLVISFNHIDKESINPGVDC